MTPNALCRACLTAFKGTGRCPSCGSPRVLRHAELNSLAIAHVDCDAFYASVEKRDDPSLADKPLIVGGGRRGVVTTACYIARIRGVRSAMPMFKALQLCPDAVVVPPRLPHYAAIGREIRNRMEALTPLVEPLSLDEAFLDLRGTERLHRAPAAVLMARFQAEIERDLGLTVSVGLSHNKFLAKIASEMDKPRGFSVIGQAETLDFLAPRPVSLIWGVGPATLAALHAEGIHSFADLRRRDRTTLIARFGSHGDRLWHLAQGLDARSVSPGQLPRSVSNETTFAEDVSDLDALKPVLWDLAEAVSGRLKARCLVARTVMLKLKRADHRLLSRRLTVGSPVRMADSVYRAALPMLQRDMTAAPFRLLGIGVCDLHVSTADAWEPDLFDPNQSKRLAAEHASDAIRNRFGPQAIVLGRSFR